jgi:uncharacterized repeat protein (TIGR01451 family)
MKKLLIISILVWCGVLMQHKTEAQPVDTFQVFIGDTLQGGAIYNCPASTPVNISMSVWGFLNQQGDLINMGVDYGDGVDSTFSALYNWGVYYNSYHTYAPGDYQLTFWAQEPGGMSDTTVVPVHVSAGCATISGNLYEDLDEDCFFDAGEPGMGSSATYIYLEVYNGSNYVNSMWTQPNGSYTIYGLPDDLTYTISPKNYYLYANCYAGVCPAYISLPAGSASDVNFGLFTDDSGFDLAAYTFGWGFRPAMQGTVSVSVMNHNCVVPTGGTLKVLLDPLLTYSGANQTLTGMSGDTLLFTVPVLSGSSNIYHLVIDVLTETSAVYGDPINCNAIIEPIASDVMPLNNISELRSEVRASWDPNDKQVAPAGDGTEGNVEPNTILSYLIRFQNTGNAEAINISVLDTLDSDLDINTFQLQNASHYCTYTFLSGNVIEFTFNNIWLPDSNSNEPASHGSILYSIRMKPSLPEGTQIHNTAAIYFDYNPPVITNTTLNTIKTTTTVQDFDQETAFVYPNPANEQVNISLPFGSDGYTVEALDFTGRKVMTWDKLSAGTSVLNTSKMKSGIYILKLTDSNGMHVANMKVTILGTN